ncbi:MAG: GIY-YIG nuclease family protein [Gammaproteobacteria bacterium]
MLASRRNGTLYVGVTSELPKRIWQHKEGLVDGLLVWFERHDSMESAITREKQLKRWNRMWKLREIELLNPEWKDLYDSICH